jgi:hypothetical protein
VNEIEVATLRAVWYYTFTAGSSATSLTAMPPRRRTDQAVHAGESKDTGHARSFRGDRQRGILFEVFANSALLWGETVLESGSPAKVLPRAFRGSNSSADDARMLPAARISGARQCMPVVTRKVMRGALRGICSETSTGAKWFGNTSRPRGRSQRFPDAAFEVVRTRASRVAERSRDCCGAYAVTVVPCANMKIYTPASL